MVSEVGEGGLAETAGSLFNSFCTIRENTVILFQHCMTILSAKLSGKKKIQGNFTVFGFDPINITVCLNDQDLKNVSRQSLSVIEFMAYSTLHPENYRHMYHAAVLHSIR